MKFREMMRDKKGAINMNRPQEQVTESGYFNNTSYWEEFALQNGGVEVCDDDTGEPIFTIGQ